MMRRTRGAPPRRRQPARRRRRGRHRATQRARSCRPARRDTGSAKAGNARHLKDDGGGGRENVTLCPVEPLHRSVGSLHCCVTAAARTHDCPRKVRSKILQHALGRLPLERGAKSRGELGMQNKAVATDVQGIKGCLCRLRGNRVQISSLRARQEQEGRRKRRSVSYAARIMQCD